MSNQLFQAPTATNKAIVASTGLPTAELLEKDPKSLAPSIFAASINAFRYGFNICSNHNEVKGSYN